MSEVIAGEEHILVIFDDSLVNTDPDRMERACNYLEEASQMCQIIMFTCDLDEYEFQNEYNQVELSQLP